MGIHFLTFSITTPRNSYKFFFHRPFPLFPSRLLRHVSICKIAANVLADSAKKRQEKKSFKSPDTFSLVLTLLPTARVNGVE